MKIFVKVYGCTANKADASLIKGLLLKNNYKLVENSKDADIIIVLTCTVIDTTEQKILSKLKKYKETGKKIIVAGCMASAQSEKIKKILPNAKLLPPQYSHQIIDIIKKEKIVFEEKNKTESPKHFDSITAPISIAEGCMFSCTYCITTIARGKLRSFPITEIKKDVKFAVKNGCKEIQITAQDTSSYGFDSKSDLGKLIKNISQVEGDYRIRIGMMNPFTCLKNLNSIIESYENKKIYKFLHLPVQSGDNTILEKMNRKYTVEDFIKIVKKFRTKYPEITLATDVIAGFPSETDEQFEKTILLLKELKPDITNITRFSARPKTVAKKMKNRINTEIVKKRSKNLTKVCSKISYEQNKKHLDKIYEVLVTEKGKNSTFVGRSGNYKPVVLKENVEIGKTYTVKIKDFANTYLVGSII